EEFCVGWVGGGKNNPTFLKNVGEFVGGGTGGKVPPMEKLINPQDATSRLTLASFLAKHGKSADAVSQVRQAGTQLKKSDRALVRETINALLNDKEFYDAYRAWAATHGIDDSGNAVGQVINGDFADPIELEDSGFGWQLLDIPAVSISGDLNGPVAGTRSLCLQFSGNSDPATSLIRQLVLVSPQKNYSLSFMTLS